MSQCVRQAYICGIDKATGRDYTHRKEWVVLRIKHLAQSFFVDICAYAVMSNHYHIVLKATPELSKNASDIELLDRWERVYPQDANKIRKLKSAPGLYDSAIAKVRQNLNSISRYMAALNENIGLRANQEDDVKGRFWSNRFKSQALLDEGAILTAMAYVDLNPVRAGVAATPDESLHTSIYERIQHYQRATKANQDPNANQPMGLVPLLNSNDDNIEYSLGDYLQLVDETSRVIRNDKRGYVPAYIAPILERIGLTSEGFVAMVQNLEQQYNYAVGHIVHLKTFTRMYGRPRSEKFEFAAHCYKDIAA